MLRRGNVLPNPSPQSDCVARGLFGPPRGSTYRRAIAKTLSQLKELHSLSNVDLAEMIGTNERTIRNAVAESTVDCLHVVTLLRIAYEFGEEAIEPVRALYLCASQEPETTTDKRRRLIRELAALEDEQ